jgi:hypothetical protein
VKTQANGGPGATQTRRETDHRNTTIPVASASVYEPVPGRGWVWLSIRCPYCSGVHLGRVRPGKSVGGKRRTTCGTVIVIVRRRYRAAKGGGA